MARTQPDTAPEAVPVPKAARSNAAGMSLYDARPFFEKALQHGLRHGLIDAARLDAIAIDAPKGMVQIARYFGNEFSRPDLEKARERIVNLVSLYLEHSTGGDLTEAAQSLQTHSLLSRSKGGSNMLKALLAMPEDEEFYTKRDPLESETTSIANESELSKLAEWSLKSFFDYKAELEKRAPIQTKRRAAIWLSEYLGIDVETLEEDIGHASASPVIRSALLTLSTDRKKFPDWVTFEKMVLELRKKFKVVKNIDRNFADGSVPNFFIRIPKELPAELVKVVELERDVLMFDLPRIINSRLSSLELFRKFNEVGPSAPLLGRYFWLEDSLAEMAEFDTQVSKAWVKATGGQTDESALLTLFLCVAAGSAAKTMLTEKTATTLIRKIRKTGFYPSAARDFILAHAPVQFQGDYARLWTSFVEEAQPLLTSDATFAMEDALALLRLECQVK